MTFGEVVKTAREALGYTQGQVASGLKVSRETVGRWECDTSMCNAVTRCDVLTWIVVHLLPLLTDSYKNKSSLEDISRDLDHTAILEKLDILLGREGVSTPKKKRTRGPAKRKDGTIIHTRDLTELFAKLHLEHREYGIPVHYGAWGAVIVRLGQEYTDEAIAGVMKAFFETPGRTRTSIYDFEKAFGNMFGYLWDKAEGKRK